MSETTWNAIPAAAGDGHGHGMHHSAPFQDTSKSVAGALAAVVVGYALSSVFGLPQKATELTLGAGHAVAAVAAGEAHHEAEHADHHAKPTPPAAWTIGPFALLLLAIAVFPLLPHVSHWWESNLHRFMVAMGLGTLTLCYYLFLHAHPVEKHFLGHGLIEAAPGASWLAAWTIIENAVFVEYIPFIVLLFSLYTICGGIRIEGDLKAHAGTNTCFMLTGGLLASFIGTTGAAMLLIRPLLDTNRERRYVSHTVVFFIFVVCNCGGCLTPLGDPPLFLGYLQGVDFMWTLKLWPQFLMVNSLLLATYFVWDHFFAYPKESKRDVALDETLTSKLRISGLGANALLLLGIIGSVALLDPSKTIPGTDWHPWLYLREVVQLGLVAASLLLSSTKVREANSFNYTAIIEVAALFVGIFICMQPALQILGVHGGSLGIDTPTKFFWATGGLSAVLDNAPTYLVFFQTAQAIDVPGATLVANVAEPLLVAISLGAVFCGAMTYIGNGPNFMVRAIAEQSGVKMPSFFGYLLYSCAVLLPILALTQWLTVR